MIEEIVSTVFRLGLILCSTLTLIAAYRIVKGPTTADRAVALDTISTNIAAIGVLTALITGKGFFILISLVIGIIGFISTTTVAMYLDEGDIIV